MAEAVAFAVVGVFVVALVVWRLAAGMKLLRPSSDPRLRPSPDTVRRIRNRNRNRATLSPAGPPHVRRLHECLLLENDHGDDDDDGEVDQRVAMVLSWHGAELRILDDGESAVRALTATSKKVRAVSAGTVPAPMPALVVQLGSCELAATVRGIVDEVLSERSAVPTGYASGFADGHRAVGDVLHARAEVIAERRREITRDIVARLEAIESFNARRVAAIGAAQQADEFAGVVATALTETSPALDPDSARSTSAELPDEARDVELRAISRIWIERELRALEQTATRWRGNLATVLASLPDPVPEPRRVSQPSTDALVRDLEEVMIHPPVPGGSGEYVSAYDFAYRGVLDRLRRRIDAIEGGPIS